MSAGNDPAEAIRAVDSGDQLDAVLSLPDHLRDALWRIESAQLQSQEQAPVTVICGMGGSAIGGELAAAALGDRLSKALPPNALVRPPERMMPRIVNALSPTIVESVSLSPTERRRRSAQAASDAPPGAFMSNST